MITKFCSMTGIELRPANGIENVYIVMEVRCEGITDYVYVDSRDAYDTFKKFVTAENLICGTAKKIRILKVSLLPLNDAGIKEVNAVRDHAERPWVWSNINFVESWAEKL